MNILRVCLLLVMMASIGLYATAMVKVEKGDYLQAGMELSVKQKDNPENKNTVTITVSFKDDGYDGVGLVDGGKYKSLKRVVKDGVVSVSFEIEKTSIEKDHVVISKESKTGGCGVAYLVYLKDYVS